MHIEETHCCGVSIMSWITSQVRSKEGARDAIVDVISSMFSVARELEDCVSPKAQYMFVDVKMKTEQGLRTYRDYNGEAGRILTEYIITNGLGQVVSSNWNTNPVHQDRELKTYVWTPNPDALKKWAAESKDTKAAYKKYVKEHTQRNRQWRFA